MCWRESGKTSERWCLNKAARAVARRPRTQLIPPLPARALSQEPGPFVVKEDIKCIVSQNLGGGKIQVGQCLVIARVNLAILTPITRERWALKRKM